MKFKKLDCLKFARNILSILLEEREFLALTLAHTSNSLTDKEFELAVDKVAPAIKIDINELMNHIIFLGELLPEAFNADTISNVFECPTDVGQKLYEEAIVLMKRKK